MQACAKLRLLNTPLAGRQLLLPEGIFTIGRKDCDLLLPLEKTQLVRIILKDNSATLDSDTPCWVNGRSYKKRLLPFGECIDLDGICFILAEPDTEIPILPAPKRTHFNWRTIRLSGLLVVVILVISCVIIVSLLPDSTLNTNTIFSRWITDTLKKEPTLKITWHPQSNMAVFNGSCQHSQVLSDLSTRLQNAGVHVQQNIVCQDELTEIVQSILDSFGYTDAHVSVDAKGQAIIETPLRHDEHFKALSEALDQQPGLSGWKVIDRSADELTTIIQVLRTQNMLTGISASRTQQGWILTGQLNENQQNQIQLLVDSIQKRPHWRSTVRFINAINTVNLKHYFPAPINGMGGNADAPFLELANGTRLQEGSTLLKNMRIIAISRQGISISDGHQLIFIAVNS